MKSSDAESLGLYDHLTELEAEWSRYKADITLYPSCVAQAIIGDIHNTRKMIRVFEASEQSETLDKQLTHNAQLNQEVEMEWSA